MATYIFGCCSRFGPNPGGELWNILGRIQGPGSWTLDPVSWILDPGIQDPGSRIQDPGSWIPCPGSRIPDPGSRILDPGSWIPDWIQDPECWMQDPECRIQESGSRTLDPASWDPESRRACHSACQPIIIAGKKMEKHEDKGIWSQPNMIAGRNKKHRKNKYWESAKHGS